MAEFNPDTAASSGLTWTQHEQCRASFEEHCLRQVFEAAVVIAMSASPDQDTLVVAGAAPPAPCSYPEGHRVCTIDRPTEAHTVRPLNIIAPDV